MRVVAFGDLPDRGLGCVVLTSRGNLAAPIKAEMLSPSPPLSSQLPNAPNKQEIHEWKKSKTKIDMTHLILSLWEEGAGWYWEKGKEKMFMNISLEFTLDQTEFLLYNVTKKL